MKIHIEKQDDGFHGRPVVRTACALLIRLKRWQSEDAIAFSDHGYA
ncbi:MAG: hypothetical protein AAFN77_03245 [Planctomycetota bacterium]